MSRSRSFSFPKLGAKRQDASMSGTGSPYHFAPAHSRESSGASTASTPVTPTFSSRSHSHWSSNSSLATTPDSPINLTKSPLHDLVEDPEEREDGFLDHPRRSDIDLDDEPLCICDTPFCAHQRNRDSRSTVVQSPMSEWTPGDDSDLASQPSFKRRRSGEHTHETFASRISRRWPSVSKRWTDLQPTTSVSSPAIHSAPPSRAPSLRLGGLRSSLSLQVESRNAMTPPFTPIEAPTSESDLFNRRLRGPPAPIDIQLPDVEDPIDRMELASTPLLPPTMDSLKKAGSKEMQSPLQSPAIAESSETFSYSNTPTMTPAMPGMPTPPLSTQPSLASFGRSSSTHMASSSEIPTLAIDADGDDPWAAKLGHANFQITPLPYFPEQCDPRSCKRLLDDWELARMEWMRQHARISDNYGPTSHIFRLAEQKWAEIDATWRANHELANAQAGVAESLVYQPLAETAPLTKLPSLNDPQQPAKFPKVDDSDIVGPMVQYAKIQRRPSKRAGFLKLFTDPASLLGRSAFSIRR